MEVLMNRNSIRTKVRVASCCLAGAVVISGSSFISNAAVNVGTSNFASVAEAEDNNVNPSAGVSLSLAQYANEQPAEEAKGDEEKAKGNDEAAQEGNDEAAPQEDAGAKEEEPQEAPAEKSEFADIGVSNVGDDSYINIRNVASTDGEIVGKLYSKSAVTVLGSEGEWYKIHSGNCEGYIKSEYITTGNDELAKSISTRVAIVNTDNLNIRDDQSTEGTVLGQVDSGDQLIVTEELEGWAKVSTDEGEGFVSADYVEYKNYFKVAESKEEEEERLRREEEARQAAEAAAAEEARAAARASAQSSRSSGSSDSHADTGAARTYNPPSGGSGQAVVDYACQFVGNPYVYGGSSLTNGADCSGFVMAVYAAFGVGLPHSSSGMRGVGYEVSQSEMQPGDIICYDGHVAIYVGGDTIVHASTPTTGIKYSSPAAYRSIITVRRIF
jgi:cell wall-associated NlpC family hydrolase